MILRKEVKRFVGMVALATLMMGCHNESVESLQSSTAPNNNKYPYHGDKYSWGGIADASGGLVVGTVQTMEGSTYTDPPKFFQLAGPEGFVSMSGWVIHPAKPSDVVGDWQPLPHEAHDASAKDAPGQPIKDH